MNPNIDSKILKIIKRPLDNIPEKNQLRNCISEIARHIQEDRDCLLVTTPASLKTHILFAIASLKSSQQNMRIVLPERSHLSFSYPLNHFDIQSTEMYLKDSNKKCSALLVDEGERIDDPDEGELLESLLIESDSDTPLVLAINSRSNIDAVASWLSGIRKRKCMVIHAQFPKTIFSTYLTHKGEWLPLLDRKKLHRKVKNHIKGLKKPIPLAKIFFQCFDLLNAQQLFPAIFVLPDITTAVSVWKKYPEKAHTPGQYMTAPQIVSIMDEHPELKENTFVFEMLKKRAGICFNNSTWLHLLEGFFFLGALDVIITTPEIIPKLYCSGKSLILMAHPDFAPKYSDISQSLWYDQLLMRTGPHSDFLDESQKQHVFCILTDAPDVSPVHVKDYLDPGSFALQSHFKWDIYNVLGRIARKRSSMEDLNKTFLVASQGASNNVLFHDAAMEIQAEFPDAKCLPVNGMSFLNSMRIKWTNELTEHRKQFKFRSNKKLETKFQTTQFLLDCIPCIDCKHESLCHQRGSKRFRELIDRFYAFFADKSNGHLILETTIPNFLDLLQQIDWVDYRNVITPKGELAYHLSSIANPLLIECLANNLIPRDNHRLGAAILAGFMDDEWGFPRHVDLRYPAISSIYQEFWPYLKESAQKMLALGLYPSIPDYQLSCLYYSLSSEEDSLILIEQTNLNKMTINLFINRINYLFTSICLS